MFRQVKRWAAGNTKCLFNHPPSRQHPHLTMPLHVFLIRTVWWVSCYSSFQWYEYVMLMYIHWIEKNEIDWKLPACVSYNCFCCFHSKPLIFSLFYPIVKIQRKKKEKKYLRNYLIMMIFFSFSSTSASFYLSRRPIEQRNSIRYLFAEYKIILWIRDRIALNVVADVMALREEWCEWKQSYSYSVCRIKNIIVACPFSGNANVNPRVSDEKINQTTSSAL